MDHFGVSLSARRWKTFCLETREAKNYSWAENSPFFLLTTNEALKARRGKKVSSKSFRSFYTGAEKEEKRKFPNYITHTAVTVGRGEPMRRRYDVRGSDTAKKMEEYFPVVVVFLPFGLNFFPILFYLSWQANYTSSFHFFATRL